MEQVVISKILNKDNVNPITLPEVMTLNMNTRYNLLATVLREYDRTLYVQSSIDSVTADLLAFMKDTDSDNNDDIDILRCCRDFAQEKSKERLGTASALITAIVSTLYA